MNIGWPGSVHDARVLANSSIYAKCENNKGFDQVRRSFDGVEMTPFFIGDAAYPLLPWLIKPFRETSQLSDEEKHFNYRYFICTYPYLNRGIHIFSLYSANIFTVSGWPSG